MTANDPYGHPYPIPVKDPTAPQCGQPDVDWQGKQWRCCLPPGHLGDHYAKDSGRWQFWGGNR